MLTINFDITVILILWEMWLFSLFIFLSSSPGGPHTHTYTYKRTCIYSGPIPHWNTNFRLDFRTDKRGTIRFNSENSNMSTPVVVQTFHFFVSIFIFRMNLLDFPDLPSFFFYHLLFPMFYPVAAYQCIFNSSLE